MKKSQELLFYKTSEYSILTPEQEKELFERYQNNHDQKAREILYYSNIRLVKKFAGKMNFSGVELSDLIQEGLIGLGIAIDKYDITKECKFSTYASFWIKQLMQRYVLKNYYSVNPSIHVQEKMKKINKYISSYHVENGYEPSDEVIARGCNLAIEDVKEIKKRIYNHSVISLNDTISSEDNTELGEFFSNDDVREQEDINYDISINMAIENCLSVLSPKEQDVLVLHYGLFGVKNCSFEDIGKAFHVSKERIRRIEENAFRKIKIRFNTDKRYRIDDGNIPFQQLCKRKNRISKFSKSI